MCWKVAAFIFVVLCFYSGIYGQNVGTNVDGDGDGGDVCDKEKFLIKNYAGLGYPNLLKPSYNDGTTIIIGIVLLLFICFIIYCALRAKKEQSKRIASGPYVGIWDFESYDNFDEYMKAAGFGFIFRKIQNNLKPQIVIKVDGDHWRMQYNTTSKCKSFAVEFDLGKEFEETDDGRKVMRIFTLEGGKLHHVKKAKESGDIVATSDRYIEGGKLIVEMECNGVKAKHVYTKAAA